MAVRVKAQEDMVVELEPARNQSPQATARRRPQWLPWRPLVF